MLGVLRTSASLIEASNGESVQVWTVPFVTLTTIPGLKLDVIISVGKLASTAGRAVVLLSWKGFHRSGHWWRNGIVSYLPSEVITNSCRTWLCLRVWRPWGKADLQPVRMCLSVAGGLQTAQDGSSPCHWFRFLCEGKTLLVDLLMSRLPSLSQRSFHVNLWFSRF